MIVPFLSVSAMGRLLRRPGIGPLSEKDLIQKFKNVTVSEKLRFIKMYM